MENKDNSADKNMKKTDSANLQLTKIMEQILQMLQKNSIHMDLSDEDSQAGTAGTEHFGFS